MLRRSFLAGLMTPLWAARAQTPSGAPPAQGQPGSQIRVEVFVVNVPVTVTDGRLLNGGALTVGAGGARNFTRRPALPSAR